MMGGPLLALSSVGKDYARTEHHAARARLVFDLLRGRGMSHAFRALDDVSFQLAAGESLGIIGENGAGKSTLLKIVAGVITPTRGRLQVHGRVGALLELGSGFHPEYTGLANIDLAAALLGLAPAEIAAKREAIIAFADIGSHIHDPIKHYSSGMVVRLGFAVATALEPDILITDEVLAVGDESFQKKCIAWMEGYLAGGGTLLLCSHSMYHVQKLCRSALWLKEGRVERHGSSAEVTQAYLAYHEEMNAAAKQPGIASATGTGTEGAFAIESLTLDHDARLRPGGALTVRGSVFSRNGPVPVILIAIVRADGTPVYGIGSDADRVTPARIDDRRFSFEVTFPELPLLPGKYLVRVHALDGCGDRLFENVEKSFVVEGDTRELGMVRIAHRWRNGADTAQPAAAPLDAR